MLIGIDASRAVKDQKTGTEHYSEKIIYHISKIDTKNDYILYAPNMPTSGLLLDLPKNFTWKIMPFPRLWSQIRLSWEIILGKPKPDVVFEPAHTIPIFHHKNTIVTLHDLGFKYYPELYTRFERFYHNWCMDFSAKRAKRIITPSEATKKDIIKFYHTNPEKISVIYHGYNKNLYNQKTTNHKPKNINQNSPYIFFVGRLEEKKNLENLVEAYSILRQNESIKHKLILAGKPGYHYEEIKAKIQSFKPEIKNDIIETGYVSEKDLAEYMRNASVLFFPSCFEGFGLPVLEAFASGVPVVASNTTSIPEIAKNAAILVDPRKPIRMAEELSRIIKNPDIKDKLIAQGLKRAQEFSWEKSAQQHLDAIIKTAK